MAFSKYPESLDDSSSLPITTDNVTPVTAEVVNRLREAIINTQTELGTSPSSTYGDVRARLSALQIAVAALEAGTSGDFSNIQSEINDLDSTVTTHIANTSNPHSVTAAQVGAVTIATFNTHTSDTSNPHSVTAGQVGAPRIVSITTDHAIVRFNGVSGEMQNSINGPIISDDGQVQLLETSDPVSVSDSGFVYTKDVSGVSELFYKDDDNNVTQLTTSGGSLVTGTGTDNTVVRWNDTNAIQNSGITIDDSDNISGATSISSGSTPVATVGAFRMGVNDVIAARNSTNTANVSLLQVQGSNAIIGSTSSPGSMFIDAGAGHTVNMRPNAAGVTYSFSSNGFFAGGALIQFLEDVSSPTINQADENDSTSSQNLLIHAQDNVFAGSTGGDLLVRPGTGTSTNGQLFLQDAVGTSRVTINASGNVTLDGTANLFITHGGGSPSIAYSNGAMVFTSASSSHLIASANTASGTGSLEIHATDMTGASGSLSGGTLNLSGGDASGAATDNTGGPVNIQGGDATNAGTNTGGDVTIRPGSGADANGSLTLADGSSNSRISINSSGNVFNNAASNVNMQIGGSTYAQVLTQAFQVLNNSYFRIFERSTDAPNAANSGSLYTLDVGGITELFYIDNNGAITQLTDDGYVAGDFVSGVGTDNAIARWSGTSDIQGSGITINDSDAIAGVNELSFGSNPSTTGTVNFSNNFSIYGRNSGDTGDSQLIYYDLSNNLNIGNNSATLVTSVIITAPNTANVGVRFNSAEAGFVENGSSTRIFNIADENDSISSSDLEIHSQDNIVASASAGNLILRGGIGTNTTSNGGDVEIRPGTGTNNNGLIDICTADQISRIRVNDSLTILGHENLLFEDSLDSNCTIGIQLTENAGHHLILQAQETAGNGLAGGNIQVLGGDASNVTAGDAGHVLISGGTGTTTDGNIALGSLPSSWQSGEAIIFMADATAAPTGDPTSGGFMYSEGGAGKWRGSSGTITTFGPADPRCFRCGLDFVVDAGNPTEKWHKSICLNCLMKALTKAGIDPDEYVMRDMEGNNYVGEE